MNRNARESVLDRIVATKRTEVAALRRESASLRARAEAAPATGDFHAALVAGGHVAVIAEVKRRSPSAGEITADATPTEMASVYAAAGAAAISVLTDRDYFGGELADLEAVTGAVDVPVLRKDFTIDVLQIWEAKTAGAAAILLITRILDNAQLRDFADIARELGLAALVEVHDEAELERALRADALIVGVNNRDLATFDTDLAVTERVAREVPREVVLVGESGIRTVADVERLADAGVSAVLVGETLMRADDPFDLTAAFAAVARR